MGLHEHQEKLERALKAIEAVYDDDGVARERTRQSLERLAQELVVCQAALTCLEDEEAPVA